MKHNRKYVICVCGEFRFVNAYGDRMNFSTFAHTANPGEATVYSRDEAYSVAKRLGIIYYQPMVAY